jgi:hypothetical protein
MRRSRWRFPSSDWSSRPSDWRLIIIHSTKDITLKVIDKNSVRRHFHRNCHDYGWQWRVCFSSSLSGFYPRLWNRCRFGNLTGNGRWNLWRSNLGRFRVWTWDWPSIDTIPILQDEECVIPTQDEYKS